MKREEMIERLREYLPGYLEHGQGSHWAGLLPVVNRALVIHGSALCVLEDDRDETPCVDLVNVTWSPPPRGVVLTYNALMRVGPAGGYGFHRIPRDLAGVYPRGTRFLHIQSHQYWPPRKDSILHDGEPMEVGPWFVLWEPEMDWEKTLARMERGEIPPTPDPLSYPTPCHSEVWEKTLARMGRGEIPPTPDPLSYPTPCHSEVEDLARRIGVAIDCEVVDQHASIQDAWLYLLADFVLAWRESPDSVRERLPWEQLWRGLEGQAWAMQESLNLPEEMEGAVDLLVSLLFDAEEVLRVEIGYGGD